MTHVAFKQKFVALVKNLLWDLKLLERYNHPFRRAYALDEDEKRFVEKLIEEAENFGKVSSPNY